jgi:lipid-binding SYLF domain-containing protein
MRLFNALLIVMITLVAVAGCAGSGSGSDESYQATVNRLKKAPETAAFFQSAYGYALFPTVGKGGIGFGGAYGEGRVYRGGRYIGDTSLTQVSLGLQFGVQAYSEVIFFQDKAALDAFTSGSFEFGAQASAVALTLGASAQAGSSGVGASVGESHSMAKYIDGMAVFTMTKGGLMYEASIGGQGFTFSPR